MDTRPPGTHLEERAEIKRKTKTKEFVSSLFLCGRELKKVKRTGNTGHTVTLAIA